MFPFVYVYEESTNDLGLRIAGGTYALGFEVSEGKNYFFRFDEFDIGPGELGCWMDWIPENGSTNDALASARDLGSSLITCDDGWSYHASSEPDVPNEDLGMPEWGIPPDRTLWWKWTCPEQGLYRISTIGSDFRAGVNVYTGTIDNLVFYSGVGSSGGDYGYCDLPRASGRAFGQVYIVDPDMKH